MVYLFQWVLAWFQQIILIRPQLNTTASLIFNEKKIHEGLNQPFDEIEHQSHYLHPTLVVVTLLNDLLRIQSLVGYSRCLPF